MGGEATRIPEDEPIEAAEADKRLLDEIVELTKKVNFTKADQNRVNELVERLILLARSMDLPVG